MSSPCWLHHVLSCALAGVSNENRDTVKAETISELENGITSGVNGRNSIGKIGINRSVDTSVHEAHSQPRADDYVFLGAEDRSSNSSAIQNQGGGRPTSQSSSLDLWQVEPQQSTHEAKGTSDETGAASNDDFELGLKGLEEVQQPEDKGFQTREKPPAPESLRAGRHYIEETRPSSGDSSRRAAKQHFGRNAGNALVRDSRQINDILGDSKDKDAEKMRQVEEILSHQPAKVLDSESIFNEASDLGAASAKVDEHLEAGGISNTSLERNTQASRSSIAMELPLNPTPKKISQSERKTAICPHDPDFRNQDVKN